MKKIVAEKILNQCPKCKAIELEMADGKVVSQTSIVEFPGVEKKECFRHIIN